MAGGTTKEVFNAGAFNKTAYAKQGDLGSKVLMPRPTGTVWRRGGTATTRWQMTAQHGGGYIFRLCPKDQPLTEACFQQHPLEFAKTDTHALVFKDHSLEIPATPVTDGPAKGWMRMPVPDRDVHPCDYKVAPGEHCKTSCPRCGAPWYAADDACPTNCAAAFPGLPKVASADPSHFPDPLPPDTDFHAFAIVSSFPRPQTPLPRPPPRPRLCDRITVDSCQSSSCAHTRPLRSDFENVLIPAACAGGCTPSADRDAARRVRAWMAVGL